MRYLATYVQNSSTFVMLFAMTIVFCVPSFSADNSEDVSEYIIGPGDVIQLFVWQYDQFNGTMTVGPDGKITVHLLGNIPVAGFTRQEVADDITKRLSKFIKEGIQLTVSVVEFRSQKISVFGQVRNPETIVFSVAPSLLEVIMSRSIPTPDADLTAIKIIPKDSSVRKPITVNIIEILNKGDTSALPKLHPGDIIYVPKKKAVTGEAGTVESVRDSEPSTPSLPPGAESHGDGFAIHVMGAVPQPRTCIFTEEPTLTMVLLEAGSVPDVTALRYIRIIRGGAATGDKVVNVDFAEYLADGDVSHLPRLYSGDTVYVPDVTQEKMRDVSITITGRVLSPGTYRIYEPLNILDAISKAGGLTADADPENIRIRKETADSYQEKIISIDEYLRDVGSTAPPEMVEQGYSIYVPAKRHSTSVITSIARGLVTFVADVAMIYSFWRVVGD